MWEFLYEMLNWHKAYFFYRLDHLVCAAVSVQTDSCGEHGTESSQQLNTPGQSVQVMNQ